MHILIVPCILFVSVGILYMSRGMDVLMLTLRTFFMSLNLCTITEMRAGQLLYLDHRI